MRKRVILIDGAVTTSASENEWVFDFVAWLESRGEVFEGLPVNDEFFPYAFPSEDDYYNDSADDPSFV